MTTDERMEELHSDAIRLYANMTYSHLRLTRDEHDFGADSEEAKESLRQYIQNLLAWQKARDAVNGMRTRRP